MPFSREAMSGCCAAAVFNGGSCTKASEIPGTAGVTIIWLKAKDKESIDYLSPAAKAVVTVGDKVMMSFYSQDLRNLKNKTIFEELDKKAQEMGRKDRNDIRVGDFVIMGEGAYLEGGRPFRVARVTTQYNEPAVDLEYWYTYSKVWQRYGTYRLSTVYLSLYPNQKEFA